jgi:hypothetical protein
MKTTHKFAFLAAFALVLAVVPVAFAAKGGKPSGGGGTTTGAASLTVSPTSVPSGASFSGWGCGYTTGQQANVVVVSPSSRMFFPTGVDSTGCIAFSAWTSEAGQYTIEVYQSGGRKQILMASAPLSVY